MIFLTAYLNASCLSDFEQLANYVPSNKFGDSLTIVFTSELGPGFILGYFGYSFSRICNTSAIPIYPSDASNIASDVTEN